MRGNLGASVMVTVGSVSRKGAQPGVLFVVLVIEGPPRLTLRRSPSS